jgi:hypothetical protein
MRLGIVWLGREHVDPRAAPRHTSYTFSPSALYVFSFLPPLLCLVRLCRQVGTTCAHSRHSMSPQPCVPCQLPRSSSGCACGVPRVWPACSVFGGLSIFLLILLLGGTGHTSPIKIWGHIPRLDASDVVVCGYLSPVYLFDVDRCTHASQKKSSFEKNPVAFMHAAYIVTLTSNSDENYENNLISKS